jgi:hypothetical protein
LERPVAQWLPAQWLNEMALIFVNGTTDVSRTRSESTEAFASTIHEVDTNTVNKEELSFDTSASVELRHSRMTGFYSVRHLHHPHRFPGRHLYGTLDIDGHPSLSSFQSAVAREEIAAIDPDFIEVEASVPDGMR